MMNPVMVIGAGPVGLTMACELKRYGIPVRVIEKSAQRTDKSKAIVIWGRTLELLDRGGDSEPFIKAGFKVQGINFFANQKKIARLDLGVADTKYSFALMLPQSETERLLEERLNNLGVFVERSVEFLDVIQNEKRADVTLKHLNSNREEKVSTEWVLACDGAHSKVRQKIGATFDGHTMQNDWVLADVHLKGYPLEEAEASVFWHRDGAFAIFPITPGRFRVVADLPNSTNMRPANPTLSEVQAIINRRGPSQMEAFDPIWLSGFRINSRMVSRYRWSRTFLVGDAAHIHSPAGGQGMNTGMQDAFNLAWKLAMVSQNKCNESILDSYDLERRAVGMKVLNNASRLTTIGTTKNPVTQSIRNFGFRFLLDHKSVQKKLANAMTEVAINYKMTEANPLKSFQASDEWLAPGARVKPSNDQPPFGNGPSAKFALYASAEDQSIRNIVSAFPNMIDPIVRSSRAHQGLWLIRPDGYVACSGRDSQTITDFLEGLQ